MTALFVTGTDTGVGKTLITAALATHWRRLGFRVGAMKPIETGVPVVGSFAPDSDAALLQEAAGGEWPDELVCPFRYAKPLAPSVAAELEGRPVDLAKVESTFHQLHRQCDRCLVEGAGGIMVPIVAAFDMARLARRLGLPLLIVARAGLGTLNHTGLTIHYARACGLSIAGVILSGKSDESDDLSMSSNAQEIERAFQVQVLDEVPAWPETWSPRQKIGKLVERWEAISFAVPMAS